MKKLMILICALLLSGCAASRKQTVETPEQILTEISEEKIPARDVKPPSSMFEGEGTPAGHTASGKDGAGISPVKPPVKPSERAVSPVAVQEPEEPVGDEAESPAETTAGEKPGGEDLLALVVQPPLETKPAQKSVSKPAVDFSRWRGECLLYDLKWGFMNAGQGMLACQEEQANGSRIYHLVALTVPAGTVAALGRGYARVDSYIDPETMLPYYYYSYSRGGSKSKVLEIWFNNAKGEYTWRLRKYNNQKVYAEKKGTVVYKGPLYDSMSVFYVMRSIELARGCEYSFPVGIMKVWTLVIRVVNRKVSTVKNVGNRDVYIIEPKATSDEGLFKGKMTIWLTADDRKVPVYVTARMGLGTGEMVYSSQQMLAENVPLDNKTIARLLTPGKTN